MFLLLLSRAKAFSAPPGEACGSTWEFRRGQSQDRRCKQSKGTFQTTWHHAQCGGKRRKWGHLESWCLSCVYLPKSPLHATGPCSACLWGAGSLILVFNSLLVCMGFAFPVKLFVFQAMSFPAFTLLFLFLSSSGRGVSELLSGSGLQAGVKPQHLLKLLSTSPSVSPTA